MKKTRPIISILIAFMMVFSTFGFFSFPSSVYANENGEEIVVEENVESSVQELATPTNLIWKDESTATAAWDAVDGANYYVVNVFVSSVGNEIGTTESGTSSTEIDLQHEINTIIGETRYEELSVQFTVKAQKITDNNVIEGKVSEKSSELTVDQSGKTTLTTPTNLTLSDDYKLTWSGFDRNSYKYNYYYKITYDGTTKTGYASFIYTRNISAEDDVATTDVTTALKNAYNDAGYSGETVEISLRILADAKYSGDYSDSAYSAYSNSITYSSIGKTTLTTPTNLTLSDDYKLTWSGFDRNSYKYNYYYKITYDGTTKTGYASFIYTRNISAEDDVATTDVTTALKNAYNDAGYSGETVEISLRILADANYSGDYSDSAYSAYSNYIYYNPAGSTVINEITLSPEHLVIAVDRTMFIGKTISPENAYYSKVNWSSDDSSIAPIDANGKVTGSKKGNANITAKINNATKTIPVSVYEIATNVNDSEQSTEVMDTAKDAIESLTVDGDATGTDITDVDAACEEIVQAAQNGDDFSVDINIEEKSQNELEVSWDDVQNTVGNKEFAAAYDVTVELSHTDAEGTEHHIGNITDFENKVVFKLEKSTNLPAVTENCNREFSLARIHDGEVDIIPLEETDDGNYTAESNKFSDFVLMYNDVPCEHDYQNSVFNWSDDGKTCTITYTCTKNKEHQVTYDCDVTSEVKEAATCSKKGTTTYTAKYGDLTDTKDVVDIAIDPSAHVYGDNYTFDKAATCAEEGVESIHCSYCGAIKDGSQRSIAKTTDHLFGAWTTVKEPTCAEKGSKERTCEICDKKETAEIPALERISISKATVSGIVAKTYTGKVLNQVPAIKVNGKTLKSGTDYTLTYKNNKNVGTATVIITGKGAYTGSINKTFIINPKGATITKPVAAKKAITIKWKKQASKMSSARVTGYQVQYSTDKAFKKGIKSTTVKGYTKVSKKVTKLKAKTTYYVRVRTYMKVGGKTYYSPCSTVKKVKTK